MSMPCTNLVQRGYSPKASGIADVRVAKEEASIGRSAAIVTALPDSVGKYRGG